MILFSSLWTHGGICVARYIRVISAEVVRHTVIRDRLLAEIPDIDPETLADTLEGLTDLREMLAEVIRSALDDEALAAGLSTRLSDMKARIERFETSAKRKRELALKAMSEAEIPKLLVADFTASLRHGAPLSRCRGKQDPCRLLEAAASQARSAGPAGRA